MNFIEENRNFIVGDYIRAYDFEPMTDRVDRFVEGVILKKVQQFNTIDHYVVEVFVDTLFTETPRSEVEVPMNVGIVEHDGRISHAKLVY